jgi:peptidyl-prolyl cis-trans isomerase B (cyclophilin B)
MKSPMKTSIWLSLFLILGFHGSIAQKFDKNQAMQKETMVEITTDLGTMKVKLYNETPLHRDNFIKLVTEKTLDSTLFHRVIKTFMIQGGDPQSKAAKPGQMLGSGDVGYKIPAEIKDSIYHKRGALAAARDNNPEKASSGCQFYIVQGKVFNMEELTMVESRMGSKFTDKQKELYTTVGGAPFLDGAYTVFGELVEGFDVLDSIGNTATGPNDRPATDIRMTLKIID